MQDYEVEELLHELGLQKVKRRMGRKGVNFQFLCPFHEESRPSAAVVIDGNSVYGSCFSCQESFSLAKLASQCLNISMLDAISFLEERYGVEKREVNTKIRYKLKRYEEIKGKGESKKFILPKSKIAPFGCGKRIHEYFFSRGFTEETARKFKVGWDKLKCRVTIPVFDRDENLVGIIGRTVLNAKKDDGSINEEYSALYKESPKYLIYENFPVQECFLGENVFEATEDNTAILVEGAFDALWMHQLGFTNTLGMIGLVMGESRMQILHKLRVERVVLMLDNDIAGKIASEKAQELLKNDFKIYRVEYPDGYNDPMELNKVQILNVLSRKKPLGIPSIKKYVE